VTTLTVTEARTRLRHWLHKALAGQDVGVLLNGRVVALRPTKVHSEDWAEVEYDVTAQELDHFVSRVHEENDEADKAGECVTYQPGALPALVERAAREEVLEVPGKGRSRRRRTGTG